MIKALFTAAALTVVLSSAPAFAAKLQCNEKSMMKVEMMMKDSMKKDAMKKQSTMAMKENEMAMVAKKSGKMDECAMHLNMAQDTLMK
jgi:hypothetical protein